MPLGQFEHSMDDKGRVAIPRGLRQGLQRGDGASPVLTRCMDVPAVGVYAPAQWRALEKKLAGLSKAQPSVLKFRRKFFSNAVQSPLDAQGRVRIPPHLRRYAGLEKECTVAGAGERIEIWDRERFAREMGADNLDDELSKAVAELGL